MQMRGVILGELVGHPRRKMDEAGRALIRCPLIRRKLGWRWRVPLAQTRPPVGLQPLLKSSAVQCSDDVATDAELILSNEGQRWLQQPVGSGEYIAQDPRVLEHRRGILASITRLQADPVQVVKITGPVRADSGLRHMPEPTPLRHICWAPGGADLRWERINPV